MLDLIHKILYTGMGFAAMTEQKAKEIVAELEKRGEVSSEESKKLAQDLVDKARKHSEHLTDTISSEINKVAQKCGWISRGEFDELKRRLEELESKCCPSGTESSPNDDTL